MLLNRRAKFVSAPTCEPADQSYGHRDAGVLAPFGYKCWLPAHIRNRKKQLARSIRSGR
jgi:hypothetical protein